MVGICKLTGKEGELRESHIYPAFAVRYMKETGSKYLRTYSVPNQRRQDGIKQFLLSEEAEQKFSLRENWFSKNIFLPYLENPQRKFDYDENLLYFAISFLWRILLMHIDLPSIRGESFFSTLQEVEEEWRSFLNSSIFPTNYSNVNLFFTDRVEKAVANLNGTDYYMSRAFDGAVPSDSNGKYVAIYGKFLRFIFWAVIKSKNNTDLSQVKVNPIKGQIGPPQMLEDHEIGNFLTGRIKQIESLPKPGPHQQQKILDEIMKNPDEFLSSDAGKAIVNDKMNLNSNKPKK